MAALRQSIAETEREDKAKAKAPAIATAPKSKKAVKANPDQREMLLPIGFGERQRSSGGREKAERRARST
jgi:hypothetical protein